MPEGYTTERHYKRGKVIGKGATSTVYKFEEIKSRSFYACKQFCKKQLAKSHSKLKLMNEIKVHR